MELYKVNSNPEGFTMVKLSEDAEILAVYSLRKPSRCTCIQGQKGKHCKHLIMLGIFEGAKRIDTGYMLDAHTRKWYDPLVKPDQLDGLMLGGKKPSEVFQTEEDRLVNVVAPKLEQATTLPQWKQEDVKPHPLCPKPFDRRF